jgi:hypothetical protein
MTEGLTGSIHAFSPRAQALLRLARPRPGEGQADPGAIAERLRRYRYEPFEALIAFESLLGGHDLDISGTAFQLGIVHGFLRGGEPAPIALVANEAALFMARDGEVVGRPLAPFPRSSSLASFIEQLALFDELTRGPAPAFTVDVWGVDAAQLSRSLGLTPATEACDRFQTWWLDGALALFRSWVPGGVVPELMRAHARRLEDVGRVMEIARTHARAARFDIGCTVEDAAICAREDLPEGSGSGRDGFLRHGTELRSIGGEIHVEGGAEARIDQVRAIGGVVYGWDTFTGEGARCRVVGDDAEREGRGGSGEGGGNQGAKP